MKNFNARLLTVLICLLVSQITRAQNSTNAVASTNTVAAQNSDTNAPSTADTLKQFVANWQTTPDGSSRDDLQIKIIKLAATMNPKPELPEEAHGHLIKAETLLKAATDPSDYDLAANEYLQAQNLAPWWPDVYYNLALVREAEKQYDKAISDVNLYLASNPDDAHAAQDRLYQIQAEKELADKHAADAQAAAAKHAADEQAKAQKDAAAAQEKMRHILAGRWEVDSASGIETLTISGSGGSYRGGYSFASKFPTSLPLGLVMENFSASGTSVSFRVRQDPGGGYWTVRDYDLRVSEDGAVLKGSCSSQSNFGGVHSDTSDAKWSRVQE
ncbi:MAG TPA: hypothetical protein VIK53_11145 [Verrucomicrobiae bacterium]